MIGIWGKQGYRLMKARLQLNFLKMFSWRLSKMMHRKRKPRCALHFFFKQHMNGWIIFELDDKRYLKMVLACLSQWNIRWYSIRDRKVRRHRALMFECVCVCVCGSSIALTWMHVNRVQRKLKWYKCYHCKKLMDLPFACNSSRELQPPIDSGSAISLLSDTLSSNICIRKKKRLKKQWWAQHSLHYYKFKILTSKEETLRNVTSCVNFIWGNIESRVYLILKRKIKRRNSL